MGFNCTTCGQYHNEMPLCFGASAPDLWFQIPKTERTPNCELTSDACVIHDKHDKYFFILGRILLPIIGSNEHFIWLAWVSLSEKNFTIATQLWDTAGREKEPAYFGWLQSDLGYTPSSLNLKISVQTQPVGERPVLTIEPTEHPLSIQQHNGITFADVQKIVEKTMHG